MNAVLNHGGAWCKITWLCAESFVVFQCSYSIRLQQQFCGLFLARNFSGLLSLLLSLLLLGLALGLGFGLGFNRLARAPAGDLRSSRLRFVARILASFFACFVFAVDSTSASSS